MPTDELPVLHTRSNGSLEQPHRVAHLEISTSTAAQDLDSPGVVQNASAIQSMLRNTTEIGNVGQFPPKQHRVPTPTTAKTPKLSPGPRVASRNFAQPLPYDHRRPYTSNGRHTPKGSHRGQRFPSSVLLQHTSLGFLDFLDASLQVQVVTSL